jgi:hypothetical protein
MSATLNLWAGADILAVYCNVLGGDREERERGARRMKKQTSSEKSGRDSPAL